MPIKVLIALRRCTSTVPYLLPKGRMNQYRCLTFALILAGLTGCARQEALPTSPTPGLTPTIPDTPFVSTKPEATPAPKPILTLTPSPVLPTQTSTADLPPEAILRYQPLEIAPALPASSKPPGTMILIGYGRNPSFFINFTKDSTTEIPKDRSFFSTSPDGQRLVYCQHNEAPSEIGWLVVESAGGQVMNKLPIKMGWFYPFPIWLDNNRVMFNLWMDESNPPPTIEPTIGPIEAVHPYGSSIQSMVVLNLFTGEQVKLESNYPGLLPSNAGPGGSMMYFVNQTVVYHPSLNLVVYPKTPQDSDRAFVTLWDRKANREVASVETLGFGYRHTPLWSPDGKQFVMATVTKNSEWTDRDSEFVEEWFSVSQEGKVQQLTHFGDYLSEVIIGKARWSPDGRYLAFFLTTKPTKCGKGENLSVMDMKARQVTNYCVPGVMGIGGPPPIWSPDSKYVSFNSSGSSGHKVVVVSFEQGWAAQIAGDLYPEGWLATP